MSIEAHRTEAGRIIESEGGVQSHLQALALAKRWCAEALSVRAELETWKKRALDAETLLEKNVEEP